jgi:hypothetical protein
VSKIVNEIVNAIAAAIRAAHRRFPLLASGNYAVIDVQAGNGVAMHGRNRDLNCMACLFTLKTHRDHDRISRNAIDGEII